MSNSLIEYYRSTVIRGEAKALAREIIEDVRAEPGPIVHLTGNSYMPPLRSFIRAEWIWQHPMNDDGEAFAWFGEILESELQDAEVMMECPDYDNALYGVDLKRWQYVELEEEPDDLNGEWEPRDDA